jgi:hypothetical protein
MKNNGRDRKKENKLEKAEIEIASTPLPSSTMSWAGRTAIAVSSSGTPVKTLGTISRKVWVIAAEKIIIGICSGEKKFNKYPEYTIIIAERVLECMPGVKPLTAPIKIPNSSSIIDFCEKEVNKNFYIRLFQ